MNLDKLVFARAYLLALLVFNLAACSSMKTVDVKNAMHHSPPAGIEIGSLVQVRTLDDKKYEFRVTDIYDVGLYGKFGMIAFEDMAQLKVEAPGHNNEKTLSYVFGILGVAALLALINNADAVVLCSPTPCINP